MTYELEILKIVKEAEEEMRDKIPAYRLGFIHGAKFIVQWMEDRHRYAKATADDVRKRGEA